MTSCLSIAPIGGLQNHQAVVRYAVATRGYTIEFKCIERFVGIVGADRVIAGSDCGFGTFAGFGAVDPEIAYAKLAALSEGAALASARLGSG